MTRFLGWLIAGGAAAALTVLAMLPAAWIGPFVEQQTRGRLTLGDAQGTLWRGSAFIGASPAGNEPVTALLPGRFSWTLSPAVLIGRTDMMLANPSALERPVHIVGDWSSWQVSASAVALPAERLAGLGAPFNTIQPAGRMLLRWNTLLVSRNDNALDLRGSTELALTDVASRLSPVKPLGDYVVTIDWRGQEATMTLKTINGPMRLAGNGSLANGRFQFSGRAEAEPGQEDRLSNFLNLLGQRRTEGNRNIIALEFK